MNINNMQIYVYVFSAKNKKARSARLRPRKHIVFLISDKQSFQFLANSSM